MALANDDHMIADRLVPPVVKDFLESAPFGSWGIRAGRKVLKILQNLRDPVQHRVWIQQLGLPLRNAILLNRPLTVSLGGLDVLLTARGAVAGQIWAGLRRERHEVSFVLSILSPGMFFFDIGAKSGLFAISAAKQIGGKQVFAFEPCSRAHELLKRNLRLNRISDVNVEQAALWHSVDKGVSKINPRGYGGLNTLDSATHPDGRAVFQEDVPITTMDVFLKDRKIPRVDVMKVDVEGADLMLFRGARELLERPDAPLILCEGFGFLTRGFGYHPVEILWFLESCGYSLFALNGETGAISELKTDYQYDSMVVAVKPAHAAFTSCRARVK